MFSFLKNKDVIVVSDDTDKLISSCSDKLYDLSGASHILVVVYLKVGSLPKLKVLDYVEEFAHKSRTIGVFSNTELYSLTVIPITDRDSYLELYSLPKK